MHTTAHNIFRAIHEGKWLHIEYQNQSEQVTSFWIGIHDLNIQKRELVVDGLHLGQYTTETYDHIKIDSILSSKVVEGTFCPINVKLVRDIYGNPHKYKNLFDNVANLKILNYLEMCNRMDTVPYYSDFELVRFLDRDSFNGESYQLNAEQFQMIVKHFLVKMQEKRHDEKLVIQQLAMNVLSIHTKQGLYVLAYRKLQLDVKRKVLQPEEDITLCTEYYIGEIKENIRKYLDADDYVLLSDFKNNQEIIKDRITKHMGKTMGVDDMPYIIGLGMDVVIDLHKEYQAIIKMYNDEKVPVPIRAFFGDLLERPISRKDYPITLINQNINLDQLLAINNAMKYPVAYIQGPPGTGKTNTIINTIVTAFFNEKTVLFTSNNNHPIDGVFDKLSNLEYRGRRMLFPVLRLGNVDKMQEAVQYIGDLYKRAKDITVYEGTLNKNKDDRKERAKKLTRLLKKYEEVLDFEERRETLNHMLEFQNQSEVSLEMLSFQEDLRNRQLGQVQRRIEAAGVITDKDAKLLLDDNIEELMKYLYYTSASYIKKLDNEEFRELRNILFNGEEELRATAFSKYLSKTSNVRKLQKVFPIIITTCISAHKLGEPTSMFDMVIMDEASQCNTAVALVPVIRGESLMLVGDPQQLSPVILLDEMVNEKLKKKYNVSEEYDYRTNSVYKTFLACDAVSDEVLLHNHYRCHKKIIEFNNKKYYNSKLKIRTQSTEENPLVYIDVQSSQGVEKNTALEEAIAVIDYALVNKDKTIGVITPFVNQKKLIEDEITKKGLTNISCGTVHAFQGDEKDVVLFSTAITDNTSIGTYEWLKNNKELLNVATSRAKDKLIVLSNSKNLDRLHQQGKSDDLYELVQYVKSNGNVQVTQKKASSRALGVKPFSTETEEAFLQNLSHALENIWLSQSKYKIHKEVAIAQVFQDNLNYSDLFYSGRFDFVVYELVQNQEIPILAIELDGKEHFDNEIVMKRDKKKNEICKAHNLQIIRVENSYARRYNHIKEILINYFSVKH